MPAELSPHPTLDDHAIGRERKEADTGAAPARMLNGRAFVAASGAARIAAACRLTCQRPTGSPG